MIKLSDYIFKRLSEIYEVEKVFLVTGGGAMHLDDSVGRCKKIEYVCNHHEQACAIAAEGYSRISGKIGVCLVTTGPGGFNTLTGVLGQWTDSIPALYISGQVKQSTTINACPGLNLRQLGDQEGNIIDVVKPVTKFAEMLKDANDISYLLDKAIYLATHGRPGPVWLDIPLDLQASMIEESGLKQFNPDEVKLSLDDKTTKLQVDALVDKLRIAKSPVFYVGNGIRLSNSVDKFLSLAELLDIPVVTAISGHDLIAYDHPLFFGKPGICGDRIGNIMVQNSDLLIILGTRLSIRQVGYAYELLAPGAYKVMVDIDEAEMLKPTLNIDLKIHNDLAVFLDMLSSKLIKTDLPKYPKWINWGNDIKKILPDVIEDNVKNSDYVSSFVFARKLFDCLGDSDVICTGNGTAYTSTFQAMNVKKGMRVFANQGCASMGYDLPAAIGACVANNKQRTVLVTGDGSIQMNLQELQTIQSYKLPIKVFVLENKGYLAIKTTQTAFFQKHYVGSNPESGVICPDMSKIASAYGIPFIRISQEEKLIESINKVINSDGAYICEIVMDPEQTLFPKASSGVDKYGKMYSLPLEKMYPFLKDEIQEKCIFLNGKDKSLQ